MAICLNISELNFVHDVLVRFYYLVIRFGDWFSIAGLTPALHWTFMHFRERKWIYREPRGCGGLIQSYLRQM